MHENLTMNPNKSIQNENYIIIIRQRHRLGVWNQTEMHSARREKRKVNLTEGIIFRVGGVEGEDGRGRNPRSKGPLLFPSQVCGQSSFIALISGPHVEYVPVYGGLITQQCGAHLRSNNKSSLIPNRSFKGRTHPQIDGVWTCDLHEIYQYCFFLLKSFILWSIWLSVMV